MLVIIFSTFSQTFVPVDVIVCQGLYICNRNVQMHWAHLASAISFFLHDQLVDHACILERVCPCDGVYSECGWQLSPIWPPGGFHCLRLTIRTSTNDLLGFSSMQRPKNNPFLLQVHLASSSNLMRSSTCKCMLCSQALSNTCVSAFWTSHIN